MISEDDAKLTPEQVRKVADRLRRLCSRREYCSADVMKKATQALEGDARLAAEVVALLQKEGYVDDARYAEAYVRDKSSLAGWGQTKIRYMLRAKGINLDLIDSAMVLIDRGRADVKLRKLIENKYNSLKDDSQCRMKLLRYVLGRGYAYEEAKWVIDNILEEESNN